MSEQVIIGVDEVGRGCLSGPVTAAAVHLPSHLEKESWFSEVKDSKKLSPKKRERLSFRIIGNSDWYIKHAWPQEIDKVNILNATLDIMRAAVEEVALLQPPDVVLVDGNHPIPGLEFPQECIKGGDNIVKSIGAASIIAKVHRDHIMQVLHEVYPEYYWNKNKGYGTEEHRQAIMEYGTTPFHRTSFRGVAEYV